MHGGTATDVVNVANFLEWSSIGRLQEVALAVRMDSKMIWRTYTAKDNATAVACTLLHEWHGRSRRHFHLCDGLLAVALSQ